MGSITRQSWEKAWSQISGSCDQVAKAASLDSLETLRLDLLGRKGTLTNLLKDLKELSLEDRRELGSPANELRERLESALSTRKAELEFTKREAEIGKTQIDLTLPGVPPATGRLHPLTQILDEMSDILSRLGFSWAEGPHVENEYYNFEALNIAPDHPARDMFDTFYLKIGKPAIGENSNAKKSGALLMRTHTSPVQIRRMESARPPLRIMSPGRVFRHEATDASHSAVFHQIEGLYVDRNVSMADLKGTLQMFLQCLFGAKTQTRFRPSFFPFTEPSAEMDIECVFCKGSGCNICKRSGWLEVLGAGLVHPNVFKAVDYDADLWSGFAFGLGVERIAMLRLGVSDIRMFYQNDLRFLEQFK